MKNNKLSFKYVIPAIVSDLEAGIAPCLLGAPGIGKSSIIDALGDTLNTKVFKVACNQLATKEDLTGSRIVERKDVKSDNIAEKYTQIMFPQTNIAEAITYAKAHPDETPILYLDEINRVSDDVTSACLSLITDRRMGNVQLPENLRLISAGNDEGNVSALDTASITRFSIYHVAADQDEWLESQPNLNVFIKSVIEESGYDFIGNESLYTEDEEEVSSSNHDDEDEYDESPINFDDLEDEDTIKQMAVPRTITFTSDWLNHIGFTDLDISKLDTTTMNQIKPLVQSSDELESNIFYQLLSAHSGNTKFSRAVFAKIKNQIQISEDPIANSANAQNGVSTVVPQLDIDATREILSEFGGTLDLDHATEILYNVAKDRPELVVNLFDNALYNTFTDDVYTQSNFLRDANQAREALLLVFRNVPLEDIIDVDEFSRQENIYLTHYAESISNDSTAYDTLRSRSLENTDGQKTTFIDAILNLNDVIHAIDLSI